MTEPLVNVLPFPIEQQVENLIRDAVRNVSFAGGAGGGTTGDLDVKVAVLETHVEIIRNDIANLRTAVG